MLNTHTRDTHLLRLWINGSVIQWMNAWFTKWKWLQAHVPCFFSCYLGEITPYSCTWVSRMSDLLLAKGPQILGEKPWINVKYYFIHCDFKNDLKDSWHTVIARSSWQTWLAWHIRFKQIKVKLWENSHIHSYST